MAIAKSEEPAAEPVRETTDNPPATHPESAGIEVRHDKPAAKRPAWMWAVAGVVIVLVSIEAVPWVVNALKTVSTDDAYVNGHVTFVAPRVPGQVVRVLVDDNNRVHKGDLLVELDKQPYQVQVEMAQAALSVAQADLIEAQAKDEGLARLALGERFDLEHAMEGLNNQVADLHANVAALQAARATLVRTQADYDREKQLYDTQIISKQEFDAFQESYSVAEAQRDKAQQEVYRDRAELGLLEKPAHGDELSDVPPALDQTYSAVKVAQNRLAETAAQLGSFHSFQESPQQMLAEFYKRDPTGNHRPHLRANSQECPRHQAGRSQTQRGAGATSTRPS